MTEKNKNEMIVYQSDDGSLKLDINLQNETLWLSLNQIASLYGKNKSTISRHIKNVFESDELQQYSVVAKNATTASDGKTYEIDFYNLDMIISIGYRVNSTVATKFRQWATQTLKEYMIKGFVMDDERLEGDPRIKQRGYFDELQERVDKIRTSEALMYEKVKDLFSVTSYDYSPGSPETREFYSAIQNKFHYAVSGMTAAEIVVDRISADKENAGIVTYKGEKPTMQEAKVAKNYLLEDELKILTLVSIMFLNFADIQIARKRRISMADWIKKLDELLKLNDFEILAGKGKVSRQQMEEIVKAEMEKYRTRLAIENAKQIEAKPVQEV